MAFASNLLAPASLAWAFGWWLTSGASPQLIAAPPVDPAWAQRAEVPANTSTELDWRRPNAATTQPAGRRPALQVTPVSHHGQPAAAAVDTVPAVVGTARRSIRPRLLPAAGEPTLADLTPQPESLPREVRAARRVDSIQPAQHTRTANPFVDDTTEAQPPSTSFPEGSSDELPTEAELSEALDRRAPAPSILRTRPALQNPAAQPPAAPRTAPLPAPRGVPSGPTPADSLPDLPEFPSPAGEGLDESFGDSPAPTREIPPSEIPSAETPSSELPGTMSEPEPSAAGDRKVEPRPGFMESESEGELLTPEEERELRAKASQYNGAECGVDRANCQTTRQELVDFSIANISLDVSPLLVTVGKDLNEVLKERDNQLVKIPSRVWKDRQGKVLAEGRLQDYTNGYLVIQPADGPAVRVAARDIGEDERCFLAGWWRIPNDCQLPEEVYAGRHWTPSTFTWTASALCHKPLYFEDVQLERYGHSQGPVAQTFLSGAHFFGNVLLLPYNIGLHPPQECQYVLGHYRPGDCAPWLIPAFPWHPRAVKAQTAAVLGGVFLIP